MSPKKQYQKGLPAILPPTPRPAPEMEDLPPTPPAPTPRPDAATPTPAPAQAPSRPDRRSRWTALAWVALMVLAAVAVGGLLTLLVRTMLDDGPSAPDAGPGPAVSPVEAPPERSYVEASVQADGAIVVRQWIQAEEPVTSLSLALPDVPGDASLAASDLQVLVDGELVTGPRRVSDAPVTYTFDASTFVQLRYRLTGAVSTSGSLPGRALAVATSLDVRYSPRPRSETRAVLAPAVLSLSCAASATDELVPCGTQEGTQWEVELSGRRLHDRVAAQVNLGGE